MEWSNLSGIRFKGSAAFEVSLHPHLQLGPLRVEVVTISLSVPSGGPPRISLKVTAGISGALGPLKFLVQGIGLATDVIFQPGNAGPFGIGLGFKPPDGIGLDIDAGGFIGGGFLILDEDKGEYSGGLDLMFEDGIAVHALAILDTKLPDGGFSLLILISSEFPAIPLPFGFKLLGVGGLLGLNRSVALEALAAGLRDDLFQTILFPTDVVANAPQIISNLNRLFPQSNGHFIVGPMAKLGWATPTLVTAEVGLVTRSADLGHRFCRRGAGRAPGRRYCDPHAAGELLRYAGFQDRPAPVRRFALRFAYPRLHADRRHGVPLLLAG